MLGLFKHKVVEKECEPLMTLEEFQAERKKENDFLNPAALEVMKETYGSIKLTKKEWDELWDSCAFVLYLERLKKLDFRNRNG